MATLVTGYKQDVIYDIRHQNRLQTSIDGMKRGIL